MHPSETLLTVGPMWLYWDLAIAVWCPPCCPDHFGGRSGQIHTMYWGEPLAFGLRNLGRGGKVDEWRLSQNRPKHTYAIAEM
jgi:hypothetical protein